MSSRGTYAKGRETRNRIVAAAYELVRRKGTRSTTLRDVAAATDTSSAGVLHHFGSMDELFVDVLQMRDQISASIANDGADQSTMSIDGLIRVMQRNSGEPRLVQLYTSLAADGVEPDHVAHAYFRQRYERVRAQLATAIRTARRPDAHETTLEPERVARLVAAIADGLQLQWLYQPDFELGTEIDYLLDLIYSNRDHTEPPTTIRQEHDPS